MTFQGIFLAAESENVIFAVVLDFRPEKPNQIEKFVFCQIYNNRKVEVKCRDFKFIYVKLILCY
jgi:hypothetical protein